MGIISSAVARGISAAGNEGGDYADKAGRTLMEEQKELRVQERRLEHTSAENVLTRQHDTAEKGLDRSSRSADVKYSSDSSLAGSKYTADSHRDSNAASDASRERQGAAANVSHETVARMNKEAQLASSKIMASVHGPAMALADFQLKQAEVTKGFVDKITAARAAGLTEKVTQLTADMNLHTKQGDSVADLTHATQLRKAAAAETDQAQKDQLNATAAYFEKRATGGAGPTGATGNPANVKVDPAAEAKRLTLPNVDDKTFETAPKPMFNPNAPGQKLIRGVIEHMQENGGMPVR